MKLPHISNTQVAKFLKDQMLWEREMANGLYI